MQSIGLDESMEGKGGGNKARDKTDRPRGSLRCALLEYISASPFDGMDHVDYAVMVNGDWGTGKTYFIREFIKEVNATEGQRADQKERHQCVYYSLNGADSIDSVIDGILAAATEYGVARKGVDAFKELGELLENIPEVGKYAGWINTVSNIAGSAVRNKMLHDIKGGDIVLFLDDLERISDGLDVTALLGQVYTTFIENNIKVVFIANEKEIAKASEGRSDDDAVKGGDGTSWEREQYQREKEKYIRYTYKFICPDLWQIIDIFASGCIKQDEDKGAYDALNNAFLNEFCGSKDGDSTASTDKAESTEYIERPVNLRTVQWCCQSCGKMYKIAKTFDEKNHRGGQELFRPIIALTEFYAEGNHDKEALQRAFNLYPFDKLCAASEKEQNVSNYQKFVKECMDKHLYACGKSFLIDFVYDGILDERKDKSEAEEYLRVYETKTDPLYDVSNNIDNLETSELKKLLEEVRGKLEGKEYTVNNVVALENNFKPWAVRALGMKDCEIDDLIEESVFCDANKKDKYKLFELCRRDPGMYGTPISQNSKIAARLKEEYEEYIRQCNESIADAQYECIEDCNYEEPLFGRGKDSLFANLMAGGYYDKLVSMDNKSLKFLCRVIGENILHLSNAYEFMQGEVEPLKALRSRVEEKIKELGDKDILKTERLQELEKYIDEAVRHIERKDEM